jgi:Fe-S-cluster containining protein
MSHDKTLERLYAEIPYMECKEGCHDCCGIVPFSKEEWEAVEPKLKATDIHCPYISDEGCAIYENRPFMCRLFGTSKEKRMICPHGCRSLKLLTVRKTRRLVKKYQQKMFLTK